MPKGGFYSRLSCRREACSAGSDIQQEKMENTMKSLAKKLQRFLVSEDGPTAVEYAVMLALIIIVCLVSITSVGQQANSTFTSVANALTGV